MDAKPTWPPVRLPAVAIAMVIGIWASGQGPLGAGAWSVLAVSALVGLRRVPAAGWLLTAGLAAAALGARAREPFAVPGGIVVDDRESDTVEGWVAGPITATRGGVSFLLETPVATVAVLADASPAPLPGDRVQVTGRVVTTRGYRNPGAADRVLAAQARGAPYELRAGTLVIVAAGDRASLWRYPAAIARAASAQVAARGGDRTGNALVRAAVLGDRSALDDDTDAAWRAAGVYHALSVSGLHLAAVALVVFVTVGWGWALLGLGAHLAPRRAAAAVALPAALLYTLVTGAQIATVRALVVVAVLLVGELIHRRARAADALGLAAIAVLTFTPLSLYDPGFQLSFVAAATLILAAAAQRRTAPDVADASRLRRAFAALRRALATSTAVALATAPITAWHFHEIALGGAVGNLIVTPLVELVTIPLGLAGLALAAVVPVAGNLVLDLAIAVAGFTAAIVAALGARTPSLVVPPPTHLELAAAAALYAAWALHATGHLRGRAALVLAAVAATCLAGAWAWRAHTRTADDTLRVTFLDVGQGDAAVIELPGGEVWLVDTGGAPGFAGELRAASRPGQEVARYLRSRRIAHVAVAVISHPHPDHYLGLLAVAPGIPIDELWTADEPPVPATDFARITTWLAGHGTRVVHPALGSYQRGDVTLRVLAPRYDPGDGALTHAAADPVRSVNDNSLVLAVERAGRCVLFLGDLEAEGEEALLATAAAGLRCDVVKVPHHGSPTSSSRALVAAVRPAWAVVSLGRGNRFGFPSPAVVARWQDAGAQVLRTDEAGAITATIDRTGMLQIATQDPP